MNADIKLPLEKIFRELFQDDNIKLSASLNADDIDAWDSLNHMELVHLVETQFDIKIPFATLVGIKNVGELVEAIEDLQKS